MIDATFTLSYAGVNFVGRIFYAPGRDETDGGPSSFTVTPKFGSGVKVKVFDPVIEYGSTTMHCSFVAYTDFEKKTVAIMEQF